MSLTFQKKNIEFDNKPTTIILQNENGPCALVALVNLLLLSDSHSNVSRPLTQLVERGSNVKVEDLLQTLADIAIEKTTNSTLSNDTDIDKLLHLLPDLHKGLNVNPKFDGTFAKSNQYTTELFNIYDANLVHGWIMEPSELYHYSYEEAQNLFTQANDLEDKGSHEYSSDQERISTDAHLLREFINETATQLSSQGLQHLNQTLNENEFSILFRNDHFSTLYKHRGMLYALITDLGYKKHKNIVWEEIISVNGSDNIFCDSNFIETPPQTADSKNESKEENRIKEKSEGIGKQNEQIENDQSLARQLQQEEDERLAQHLNKQESQKKKTERKPDTLRKQRNEVPKKKPKKPQTKTTILDPNLKTKTSKKDCIIV